MLINMKAVDWSLRALRYACLGVVILFACFASAQGDITLESVSFTDLPGDSMEVRLDFDSTPPAPTGFSLESPARISLDLDGVVSNLPQRQYRINSNNTQSLIVLEADGRTRLVFNLNQLTAYETRIVGRSLFIQIGSDNSGLAATQPVANIVAQEVRTSAEQGSVAAITDVTFRRGTDGDGQIVVDLSSDRITGNVDRIGRNIYLQFSNTQVPERLNRRYDVTDFGTPVNIIDVLSQDNNANIVVDLDGDFEYIAYQSGNQFILSVSRSVNTNLAQDPAAIFSGSMVSLVFQDIDIRSVLYILAAENDLNLFVADDVEGSVTMNLEHEVPWDQALDLVLRSRNLDKRLIGNVLYVATAEVIAAQEQQELEAELKAQALAPLYTEFVQINYADANDILVLITSGSSGGGAVAPAPGALPTVGGDAGSRGLLSPRGTATVDDRTNIIIVRDVAEKLQEVRELVARLDIPVRQVLIEARIVNVSTDYGRKLGIKWGFAGRTPTSDGFRYGGNQAATIEQQNNRVAENFARQEALTAGAAARADAIQSGTDPSLIPAIVLRAIASVPIPISTTTFPDALLVDLGIDDLSASSFSIGFTDNSGLIELELSALESTGNGEVIARPKVTTQDKVRAIIRSGVRIPYQAQAGGTAGGSITEFVDAVLSLEVTPQITPDGRIIMKLNIHQDSVAPGTGNVPAINTNEIDTSVLVENGETIVLGGVFREETTVIETKTPFLGDLPYIGRLFKRTENSNRRTELLIFITPRIISDLNLP